MSTDVLPAVQSHPQPPRHRWWRRGLLAIGVLAVVASAAALIRGASSSRQIGPKLTHTVTRGDLIVTVTEQGLLESSENTEIKCKVRGAGIPVIWVIDSGTEVKPGDELVRLETQAFEDRLAEMTKNYYLNKSGAAQAKAEVARSQLAIPEYLQGRYRSELMTLEKDLAIAESSLRTAQNMLDHTEMMKKRGYVRGLEVEERTFALDRAKLNVGVTETKIDVLKSFSKAMELETLKGNLKAIKATLAAVTESLKLMEIQVDLASKDIEHCVVKAEKSGLVIHPSAARWENAPKIEEGATVYMGQTLLLMPDLSKMQVKVGIRESIVDRIKPGLAAKVTLPNRTIDGEVSSVASVTGPASMWTANVTEYDTIIKLPSVPGLKPGMSAEVEVIIGQHKDVLTIPVAAVAETADGDFCWVKTAKGVQRRSLKLGDTNDVFTVVKAGLKEGDQVVLNSLPFIEDTPTDVPKPPDETKPPSDLKKQESKPKAAFLPTTTHYLLISNR